MKESLLWGNLRFVEGALGWEVLAGYTLSGEPLVGGDLRWRALGWGRPTCLPFPFPYLPWKEEWAKEGKSVIVRLRPWNGEKREVAAL